MQGNGGWEVRKKVFLLTTVMQPCYHSDVFHTLIHKYTMLSLTLTLVKSFTQDPSQGNPTAVCFAQEDLPDETYFRITRSTGFSECVFITFADNIPVLRFFSPEKEMNMCGHATLAAAHVLKNTHQPTLLKTKAGDVKIHYHPDGLIEIEITAEPRYYPDCIAADRIAELLDINLADIAADPVKISVGTPKVLVELSSAESLWNVHPNFNAIAHEIPQGIYPYVKVDEKLYFARQFNPATGVNEDPVTGIAAAALGVHLRDTIGLHDRFSVEQGHMLNTKGTIFVDTREGIKVGGYAVECGQVSVEV